MRLNVLMVVLLGGVMLTPTWCVDMGLFDFAASLINSVSGHKSQQKAMKHGIQWRVNDANAAGVHPLYALGAQLPMYSPSSQINFGDMGQDISRARMAAQDRNDRMRQLEGADRSNAVSRERDSVRFALDTERANLENELLRSQIGRMNSAQVGPSMPAYSAPSPRFQPRAADPVISSSGNPAREAGHITDYGFTRLPRNRLGVVPSVDMQQRMEDNVFLQAPWSLRNQVGPWFDYNYFPRPNQREYPNRPGYEWVWDGTGFAERPIGTERRVRRSRRRAATAVIPYFGP